MLVFSSSLAPFDAVKLINETYGFVHQEHWGKAPYRLRPKYVLTSEYPQDFMGHFWTYEGRQYSRLSTSEAVKQYILKWPLVFGEGDAVHSEAIVSSTPARVSDNDFLAYSRSLISPTRVRAATLALIEALLEGGLALKDIGITGSVLLRGEIDGFSDFDLLLYGAKPIARAREILKSLAARSQSPLYYRTRDESAYFYKKYSVISEMTADEFAVTFPGKVSQGIMMGVPFSIFQVPTPEEIPLLNAVSAAATPGRKEKFEAWITDDLYSRYTFRSIYKVEKSGEPGKVYSVICYDRACMEQGDVGQKMIVSAHRVADDTYHIYQGDGFIRPVATGV